MERNHQRTQGCYAGELPTTGGTLLVVCDNDCYVQQSQAASTMSLDAFVVIVMGGGMAAQKRCLVPSDPFRGAICCAVIIMWRIVVIHQAAQYSSTGTASLVSTAQW